MRVKNILAASAIALLATVGAAKAANYSISLSGPGNTGGTGSVNITIDVEGGYAVSGSGTLTTPYGAYQAISLVTPSNESTDPVWLTHRGNDIGLGGVTFRNTDNQGLNLSGDNVWPQLPSTMALIFSVASLNGAFAIGENNDGSWSGLFSNASTTTWPGYEFTGNASISAVPLPAALPMFGAALVGLGGLARRRAKKAA
ncbi:MAG TPA: hypothetical protein HPQ04_10245 [Rhodospirillaceae bacterium]|nr:hypothetical protein [Rhodospirillaceae bacterium]